MNSSREKNDEVSKVAVSHIDYHYYPGGCHVRFNHPASSCNWAGYQGIVCQAITTSAPNDSVSISYKIK